MLTATGMCICIILTLYRYTLLVGKPPFETESLKDTYQRIKRNEYRIPSHISPSARSLITRLLRADPATRPTPQDILQDPFLTDGFIPARLPHRYMYIYFKVEQYYVCIFQSIIWLHSALTTAPHFKLMEVQPNRQPLSHVNNFPTTGACGLTSKVCVGASASPTLERMYYYCIGGNFRRVQFSQKARPSRNMCGLARYNCTIVHIPWI